MEFYKKNPEIKGNITIQGKLLDDTTVVCGEEFDIFADPTTFPGKPVKLVKVEFNKLKGEEKGQVEEFSKERHSKPPKHLGVVMSSQFDVTNEGDMKPRPEMIKKEKPKPPAPLPLEEEVKKSLKKESPPIGEAYSIQELIDVFPGITEVNAGSVIEKKMTLKGLSEASNSSLRRMGIAPSFFGRLRTKAIDLLKSVDEEE